jgi:hypothetical protein
MLKPIATVSVGLAAVMALTLLTESSALAQPAPQPQAEGVPTPAIRPAETPQSEPQKPETYDSLDAGRDSHAPAERKRREAIDQQLKTEADIRYYHVWPGPWGRHYARRYAVPNIRAYAPPLAALEAERAIESGLVPAPPFGPWPMPSDFFFGPPLVGEPYVDSVEQPKGHEKVWTGPNGYIYRPRQQEPTPAQREPTPAERQPAEPAAVELPGEQGPVAPPSLNPPDEEPQLSPVPGPREF